MFTIDRFFDCFHARICREYSLIVLSVIALASFSGCNEKRQNGDQKMDKQAIVDEVNALKGKRIFFGHQSIGENILEGLDHILKTEGIQGLNVVNVEKTAPPSGPLLAESRVGRNGDPKGKCDAFSARVMEFAGGVPDIALVKFCYVDFKPGTDVEALFAYYRTMVDSLRARAPRVTLVHVTVPLTIRTPGWKKLLKRILGKEESSDTVNALRCEYNDLLRRQYAAEPVFDLAAVESTHPDGSRQEFTYKGRTVYSLRPDLSSDGVHLNEAGGRAAAAEFLRVLASAASRSSK